jgi:phospholipid transport system substrate-binding protein
MIRLTASIATFGAGLLLALTVHAAASPDGIVRSATDAVRADIADNVASYQQDKAAFYAMVEQKIVPHFDTPYIAKVILGRHLSAASPEQIGEFEGAFKDMLIRTYADKLLEFYDSIEIEVKPARVDGKRANVETTIVRKDGKPPIPIIFSMRDAGGEWKIWDIKAENISLVLNFRTQIDSEIRRGSIAQVIERIRNGQLALNPDSGDGGASGS